MKLLVATHQTQGDQEGDYCWALDGELVTPLVVECSSPEECGCARGFPGLASSRPTTTALVVDLALIGFDELEQAFTDSLLREHWVTPDRLGQFDAVVNAHLSQIVEIASRYPVGTVVRRSGRSVFAADRRAA